MCRRDGTRMRTPWPPGIPEESCRGSKSSNRKGLLRLTKRRSGHRRLPAKKTHPRAGRIKTSQSVKRQLGHQQQKQPRTWAPTLVVPSRHRGVNSFSFWGSSGGSSVVLGEARDDCNLQRGTTARPVTGPSRSCHVQLGASPRLASHALARPIGTAAQRAAE